MWAIEIKIYLKPNTRSFSMSTKKQENTYVNGNICKYILFILNVNILNNEMNNDDWFCFLLCILIFEMIAFNE